MAYSRWFYLFPLLIGGTLPAFVQHFNRKFNRPFSKSKSWIQRKLFIVYVSYANDRSLSRCDQIYKKKWVYYRFACVTLYTTKSNPSFIQVQHCSLCIEEAYVSRIKRSILFPNKRHPKKMWAKVQQFLSHLAMQEIVAAFSYNQALCALVFLYKEVLKIDLPESSEMYERRSPGNCRWYLVKGRSKRFWINCPGPISWRQAFCMGRSCAWLSVCAYGQRTSISTITSLPSTMAKQKERRTISPTAVRLPLEKHWQQMGKIYLKDREENPPGVQVPFALEKKYPNAGKSWKWFWVFPSPNLTAGPRKTYAYQWVKWDFWQRVHTILKFSHGIGLYRFF